MKIKNFFFTSIMLVILAVSSCSDNRINGILGVEVPIGKEKVSERMPYIITGVYEGSPAHIAGIKPGDRIIQIDNMPVRDGMRFDDIFNNYLSGKAGTKVTIHIARGSENIVFDIVRVKR